MEWKEGEEEEEQGSVDNFAEEMSGVEGRGLLRKAAVEEDNMDTQQWVDDDDDDEEEEERGGTDMAAAVVVVVVGESVGTGAETMMKAVLAAASVDYCY